MDSMAPRHDTSSMVRLMITRQVVDYSRKISDFC